MKSLKAGIYIGFAQLIKLLAGLIAIKVIASNLGPDAFGQLGQFMSLVFIVVVGAGGGISVGITKYVAEFQGYVFRGVSFQSTAIAYSFTCSVCIFLILSLFSEEISSLVFQDIRLSYIVSLFGVVQLFIAFFMFIGAVVNGHREVRIYSMIVVIGSMLGVLVTLILVPFYGYLGAVFSLMLMPALGFIPALVFALKSKYKLRLFRRGIKLYHIKNLMKFSLMALVTLATMPVVHILVRDYLADRHGWEFVGLWQALLKLSDAYLGFIMMFLSKYYMPLLSSVKSKELILKIVRDHFLIIGGGLVFVVFFIYLLRKIIIEVLFGSEFIVVEEYLGLWLIGDFFKTLAFVIGYVAVAKAAFKIYIFGDIIQALLFYFITYQLVDLYGQEGAIYSYSITYFIYMLLCLLGFVIWIKGWIFDKVHF